RHQTGGVVNEISDPARSHRLSARKRLPVREQSAGETRNNWRGTAISVLGTPDDLHRGRSQRLDEIETEPPSQLDLRESRIQRRANRRAVEVATQPTNAHDPPSSQTSASISGAGARGACVKHIGPPVRTAGRGRKEIAL